MVPFLMVMVPFHSSIDGILQGLKVVTNEKKVSRSIKAGGKLEKACYAPYMFTCVRIGLLHDHITHYRN